MLFTKLKFSPNTVTLRLAALRFFYLHVLQRSWSIAEETTIYLHLFRRHVSATGSALDALTIREAAKPAQNA